MVGAFARKVFFLLFLAFFAGIWFRSIIGRPSYSSYRPAENKITDDNIGNKSMEQKHVKSRFKRVCVYCGSSNGKRDCYKKAALELGQELVARKLDLVYGGGSVGLMGLVARTVQQGGAHVLGIIPRALIGRERIGEGVGEVKMVANMHQRKAEMAQNSDCFIALPGGYGTMEELLEIITWAQLGIHHKPVGLLNVDGYYDSLLSFIDKAVDDGFIVPSQRHIFVSAPNAKELVQKLEEFVPEDGASLKLKWDVEAKPPPPPPTPPSKQVGITPLQQAEIAL